MAKQWATFEKEAREALSNELQVKLTSEPISINGKKKKFDLLNREKRIVGDVKYISITKSKRWPAAKISNVFEYLYLMWLLERSENNGKWRKILVLRHDDDLARKFASGYDKWLQDIEIYGYSQKAKRIITIKTS